MRRDAAGTIEVGKRADLVVLRANPLDAIANLALRYAISSSRCSKSSELRC